MLALTHYFFLLVLPVPMIGVINRTKALWAGRKGPPIFQLFFDLRRLLGKISVYSQVSTWLFQLAPWVILSSTLVASSFTPFVPGYAPWSLPFDFVVVAYLLGLGRVFLILGAMDTGSSFEGMGASREASYSALIEPALFLALGALAMASGMTSFQDLFAGLPTASWGILFRASLFLSMFILLQVESARVPVDDPNTHLELTMIHEVMILDHSGPELACLQFASATKMVLLGGIMSCLINPYDARTAPLPAEFFFLASLFGIAIGVGLVESLIARFKLKVIPRYALASILASALSIGVFWLSRRALP